MLIEVKIEDWDSADGMRLREEQRAELDARYGCDDHEPGAGPSAENIAVFLVARDRGGRAVGCGGLRLLGAASAEIKRMYVVPEARGAGVSVAVLRELEAAALRLGVRILKLETGPAQPDAIRFYEREGYRRIANFGVYRREPLSRCFARHLG
ncbi:GNAT family N-acetyltransferase [Qaidamihabitans albus]|uniref:GNAT family N-acetyltransferase n=1 Tax=Qaidamihabitans albus TaxID=2795733 RepID=UPI001F1ED966|nr:GNAT family N-acetyltransferase [Qaidamihabitans albus]